MLDRFLSFRTPRVTVSASNDGFTYWVTLNDNPRNTFILSRPSDLNDANNEQTADLTEAQRKQIVREIHKLHSKGAAQKPRATGVALVVAVGFLGLATMANMAPEANPATSQCSLGAQLHSDQSFENLMAKSDGEIETSQEALEALRRLTGELQSQANGAPQNASARTEEPSEPVYEFGY